MKFFTQGFSVNFISINKYFKSRQSLKGLLPFIFVVAPLFSIAGTPVVSPTKCGAIANCVVIKKHSSQLFSSPLAVTEFMRINLFLLQPDNSTILADGDYAEYNNLYHDSVTLEDAAKFTNILENIGLLRYGTTLSVERRPIIKTNDTLFIRLWKTTQRSYQIQLVAGMATNVGLQAFFVDSYLKKSTPLSIDGDTKISFAITADPASQATNRFMVVFKPKVYVAPTPAPAVTFTSVTAYPYGAQIRVCWNVKDEKTTTKYEVEKSINGIDFILVSTTLVTATNATQGNYCWLDGQTAPGNNYYRIKGINVDGTSKYTDIVKVLVPLTPVAFSVYPNPVKNHSINLKFINQPVGMFEVKLTNINGAVVYKTKIFVSSKNMVLQLNIASVHNGVYALAVTNAANARKVEKVIVQ